MAVVVVALAEEVLAAEAVAVDLVEEVSEVAALVAAVAAVAGNKLQSRIKLALENQPTLTFNL